MSALLTWWRCFATARVEGRKVGEVGEGLSAPGPGSPAGGADGKAGAVGPARGLVARLGPGDAAGPLSHPPAGAGLAVPEGAMAPGRRVALKDVLAGCA